MKPSLDAIEAWIMFLGTLIAQGLIAAVLISLYIG